MAADVAQSGIRLVEITARGGTRRERGAEIAAAVRSHPKRLERFSVTYSETYGFLSATYARYLIIGDK
jgi:hypothetical protein